ncbi:hypothetical protein Gorai_007829, partial [Gossypium raimondii]|nr:hypothetical protein [Gossypium raimondii]
MESSKGLNFKINIDAAFDIHLKCFGSRLVITDATRGLAVVKGDALSVIKKNQSSVVDKSKMRAYISDIKHHRRGVWVCRGDAGVGSEVGLRARLRVRPWNNLEQEREIVDKFEIEEES